jgi:diaminopimelate decarboxylase
MVTCGRRVYLPFQPSAHGLSCDGVPLQAISDETGTPLYVYSARAVREAYRALDEAFDGHPHAIHYALKANSTLALVRLLRSLGSRVDANSGGEIEVARRAGFEPRDIVFTGVGKTPEELAVAVRDGIGTINAESPGELDRIAAIARGLGRVARVALRVNPDIDARTHPHIATGSKTDKFGMPIEDARAIYRARRDSAGLRFVGVHVHVGSQITTPGRCGAPRTRSCRWRSRCATTACGSNTSISAGASASRTTAGRRSRPPTTRPPCCRRSGAAACRSCSNRAGRSWPTPAPWSRASWTSRPIPRAGRSRCSMPG